MFRISGPLGLCHILQFNNLPMVEIMQIKVPKERKLLELLDMVVLGGSLECRWYVVIKQFEVLCSFPSLNWTSSTLNKSQKLMSLSVRPSKWLWQSSHSSATPSLETILCLQYAQLQRISQRAMIDFITFHIWLHKHSTEFVWVNLSAHEYKGAVVSCADNKR